MLDQSLSKCDAESFNKVGLILKILNQHFDKLHMTDQRDKRLSCFL